MNKISGKWISVNEALPDFFTLVLIAYADKDGSYKGISTAALQPSGNWSVDADGLIDEFFDEEESIVSHWSPYQEWLTYPNEE